MAESLEDLLGAYWDIAYQEGHLGRPNGTQAQEVLSAIWAVVEQVHREEREACAEICEQIALKHQQVEGTYASGKKAGALECMEAILCTKN